MHGNGRNVTWQDTLVRWCRRLEGSGWTVGGRVTRNRWFPARVRWDKVWTCHLCHFPIVADDIAILGSGGMTICLSCYLTRLGIRKPVPFFLRRQIMLVLEQLL